jgi:hypothetical protein
MSDRGTNEGKPWCIVVADDHGPEYVPSMAGVAETSPVQYCCFGESTTLLQYPSRSSCARWRYSDMPRRKSTTDSRGAGEL